MPWYHAVKIHISNSIKIILWFEPGLDQWLQLLHAKKILNLDLILRVTTSTQMRFNFWPCTSASNQDKTTGFMFAVWQIYQTTVPPHPEGVKFLSSFVSVVISRRHKIRFHPLDFLPSQAPPAGILQTSCSMTASSWRSSN